MSRTINETDSDRWQSLVSRSLPVGGTFVYGVKTTGVYCRPTCKSRRPNRRNVVFFDDWRQAERAGFRACKRCNPGSGGRRKHLDAIIAACRTIEQAMEPPSLEDLAQAAGLSSFHFQRVFKQVTGVTPKQYAAGRKAQRFRTALGKRCSVTRAMQEAGYGSTSRCYGQAGDVLGMTPSQFRDGGKGMRIGAALQRCTLGCLLVAATERGVCAIEFGENADELRRRLRERFRKAEIVEPDAMLAGQIAAVCALVENPGQSAEIPLDIRGTAFQQRVWAALRDVRAGATTTYSELARRIGRPTAVRAVARACASNVLAVAIPCHRVVRSDGALGGYRWGLERKRALLDREARSRHD